MGTANVGQTVWAVGLMAWWVSQPVVGLVSVATAIATLAPQPVNAATLTNWRFDPTTRQLEITVPEGTTPRYFLLAQPARIVLDLPNTDVGNVPEQQTYAGPIRQIRVNQFQPGLTRIVLELAPGTELAAGQQAELQSLGGSSGRDRWILRPLLAGETPIAATPAPVAIAPAPTPMPSSTPLPTLDPAPVTPSVDLSQVVDPLPTDLPLADPPVSDTPPETAPAALPPLEPGAMEIPIEPPVAEQVVPTERPEPEPLATNPRPEPSPEPIADDPEPESAPIARTVTVEPQPLPPATIMGDRPTSITVPPLSEAIARRPAPTTPAPIREVTPAVEPPGRDTIDFGQPLPSETATRSSADLEILPSSSQTMLPTGTRLALRYPRETELRLEDVETPWQDVLVVHEAVRDRSGTVVVPAGAQVIGQFEMAAGSSIFVARALSINGQNMRVVAQSNPLEGDRRVSRNSLVRNSTLGGVALTILTGFTGIGLIGGLAVGAATTYLTSPEPAVIEPNQIIEVRIMEDVSY